MTSYPAQHEAQPPGGEFAISDETVADARRAVACPRAEPPNEVTAQLMLAALVNTSGDAVVSMDADDRITTWNPAAERLFGYPAAEVIGRPTARLVPAGLVAARQRLLCDAAAGSGPLTQETLRRHRDGRLLPVEVTVSALRAADGATIGYLAIFRDNSERLNRERQLRIMEERYRTFFEELPGLTYIYSLNHAPQEPGFLHRSRHFEAVTGYPNAIWQGDRGFFDTIIHPDDREWLEAYTARVDHTGEPFRTEFRIVTRAGEVRWLREEGTYVCTPAGERCYCIGIATDITEQKRAEAATNQALAQLRVANRELEQLSAAKSDFVSQISHELRTPLTSIQGFSELIETGLATGEEARQFAATINQNAVRLARMINDVLDLDRMEAGQFDLTLAPVSLNQIVESVVTALTPTTATHQLLLDLAPDLPPVSADADALVQLVTNLLGNAIKYAPAGGPITTRTRSSGTMVDLSVMDRGLGVPAEYRETIFDRYGRIPRAEQVGIPGTGLGLPIARHIVALHAGRIWVEPNVPHGSVFHVLLPAAEPPAE